jgi:hypothetical protein
MSGNAHIDSPDVTDRLLTALGEHLASAGNKYDLVVIGGSALLALGLMSRPTQDVDVVALAGIDGLGEALPLPEPLVRARDRVARDLDLPEDWLNSQAAQDMLRLGLPGGFVDRLVRSQYGTALTVRWASRFDQIHFKLHATVDRGGGKHFADLQMLEPTTDELMVAARWARTHDPSEAFLSVLEEVLAHFGVRDADLSA